MTTPKYKVIRAKKEHIKKLQYFVNTMIKNADMVFPPVNMMKASRYIVKMIEDETILCLVHDKEVVGSVCGTIGGWWFADTKILSEMGFWIEKEHRSIETATMLLNGFKKIADKNAVPCMLNTLDGREILAREKLFSDAGFRRVGHKYGYGL